MIKLKYGIDLSYTYIGEYINNVVRNLPDDFSTKYGYNSANTLHICLSDKFKETLANNLAEYDGSRISPASRNQIRY